MSRNAATLRSAAAVLPLLGLAACGSPAAADPTPLAIQQPAAPASAAMTLTSADVQPGATIAATHVYNANGCGGGNVSPALSWSGAPAATRSFALTIHDPDAPARRRLLALDRLRSPRRDHRAARGAGSAGSVRDARDGAPGAQRLRQLDLRRALPAGGQRPHHYNFTVSALDVATLNLPAGSAAAQVDFAVRAHTLASARLAGLYGR